MTRLMYAVVALLIWPVGLWQLVSLYLDSGNADSQIKASKADFKQEDQFWLNAEPIVSGLLSLGFIYYGLTWVGLYVAVGTLVALAYKKVAGSVE